MHPHEGIFSAFVEGQASASERQEVEAHLKGCRDCRELLSFMRDFSDIAKDVADGEIAQDEPHPQNSVIIAYEEGRLDKETSLHLRSHMLFCDRCAESYYLLKRMRAPSWVEVVIGIFQRAKDTLLKALEITGMGELVPVAEAVSRGPGDEVEEGKSKIQIAQHVTDADEEADVLLFIEPAQSTGSVRLRIQSSLEEELASIPLSRQSQLLYSSLTPGKFIVHVVRDEQVLAEYRLRIQASE